MAQRIASAVIVWAVVSGCEPVYFHLTPSPDGSVRTPVDPGPSDRVLVAARVSTSGAQRCRRPQDRDAFGPFEARVVDGPADSRAWLSGGLLAGDLDGDGLLDVLTPLEHEARLFRGRPKTMERFSDRLAAFDLSNGTGGSLADIDGDGDLDLLVLRYDQPAVLLRNDGAGHFTDASAALPTPIIGATTTSTWADIDLDGDLDLFVGSYGDLEGGGGRSYLFENDGNGGFFDRSDRLPEVVHRSHIRVGGFHDLDGDGYPELYLVNEAGSNLLLWNHHGELVLDAGTGLDLWLGGGGLGVGDLNGDDVPDFLVPQWNTLALMLSHESGVWVDATSERGIHPWGDHRVGWGAELADLDNDGDLDGVVSHGKLDAEIPGWENPERQPDALFLQHDDGTFVDVARAWGIDDDGKNRGVVVADFNGDGWLDLAKRDLDGPSTMYLSRCGRAHWLKIRLQDTFVANQNAVGARVKVFADDGRTWSRWMTAGGTGYGTGGPPEVHFGLGDLDRIARIEVRWPDGAESAVAAGLESDQVVTVIRD